MPDDRGPFDKLHRKIDRIVAGQPSSVLNDDDGEELARLAHRLREELPRDTPDPGFREELKQELIDPGPRLVRYQARRSRRLYPVVMFTGALAAVVVVTMAIGSMSYQKQLSGDDAPPAAAVLGETAPAAAGTAVFAMNSAAGSDSTQNSAIPSGDAGTSTETKTPEAATPASRMGAAVGGVQPDFAKTGLPPLDDSHVELGALATMTARREPVPENVRFSLATDLPTLEETASVYHLSTPHVDPEVLLRGIAQTLEIDATMSQKTVQGRRVYTLKADSGVAFSWTPASGAFTCDLPGSLSMNEQKDIAQAALQWLDNLGYPVDDQVSSPVVESASSSDGWNVKIPLGDIPDPAVGHPLSVSLLVNQDGRIIRATGYWLKLNRFRELRLMSAEQAWKALQNGRGYWPAGAVPDTPGEFRVESFSITYILTLSESNDVILQPVISASGTFYNNTGKPAGETTVYVQAAQLTTT